MWGVESGSTRIAGVQGQDHAIVPVFTGVTRRMNLEDILGRNTQLRAPSLCPEIQLYLLKPDAEIWIDRPPGTEQPFPYWGIAWGSGQALGRWVLDHPETAADRRVADLGCGSGIAGIAAAMAGALSVTSVDLSPDAVLATSLNAAANDVSLSVVQTGVFDLDLANFDLILAADLGYARLDLLEHLQRNTSSRQTILISEPNRRGISLSNQDLLVVYDVRAEPETEAFFVQQASVVRLTAQSLQI